MFPLLKKYIEGKGGREREIFLSLLFSASNFDVNRCTAKDRNTPLRYAVSPTRKQNVTSQLTI
jgi:hypothetical protein